MTQSWLEELQPGSPGRIDAVVVMMNMDLFNNLYKDRTAFGGMTADNVVKAALAHELGHGLGLAHAGFYAVPSESGPPYSIMDDTTNVTFKFHTPQPYDLYEVNTLYPGW